MRLFAALPRNKTSARVLIASASPSTRGGLLRRPLNNATATVPATPSSRASSSSRSPLTALSARWSSSDTTAVATTGSEDGGENREKKPPLPSKRPSRSWVVGFGARLSRFARDGNYKRALSTLDLLRRKGAINISQDYYYMAVVACAKFGHIKSAEEVVSQMRADGKEPNMLIYRNLITACAEANPSQWEKALEYLSEARAASDKERKSQDEAKSRAEEAGKRWLHPRQGGWKGRYYISAAEYNAAIDALGNAEGEEDSIKSDLSHLLASTEKNQTEKEEIKERNYGRIPQKRRGDDEEAALEWTVMRTKIPQKDRIIGLLKEMRDTDVGIDDDTWMYVYTYDSSYFIVDGFIHSSIFST